MTDRDSLTVEITAPDAHGTGIGSAVNFHRQRRHGCLIMGIKAFNHGDDFVNKFVRPTVSDSTGLDAVSLAPSPSGLTATGGIISEYTDPGPGAVYRAHIFTFQILSSDDFR